MSPSGPSLSASILPVSEDMESSANESELPDDGQISPEQLEAEAHERDADNIAEWVDTTLDDAAPLEPSELGALASECLKKAQKDQVYCSTILFAALVDFYRWMPRMGRLRAALQVAKNHVLCAQARFFEANGALKPSHQGPRERSKLLDDEGFYTGVQRWLRTLEVGTVNPKSLQRHVNETLLPLFSVRKSTVTIHHCVYWDRHERKDLLSFEKFISCYAEPNMAEIRPELGKGEVEHVVIVHDESTVHSNDYQNNHYWIKAGEQVLKKKGCGRLIMISGFLCERYGLLALTDELIAENKKLAADLRLAITDSTTVMHPDNKPVSYIENVKGWDSYWNMEQMIAQLVITILIARHLFPKPVIHCVFDNSSAHGSLAKDALTATKMKVNPGGKVPKMRDTKMTFDKNLPDDHPQKQWEGLPKGMKAILAQRGYTANTNGKNLIIGECKGCKAVKSRKPHLEGALADKEADMFGDEGNDSDEEDECPVDCCMCRLLSLQPYFAQEKSQLEVVFLCYFEPLLESNMFEQLIEAAPNMCYFRERSNGQWQKAKDLIAEALQSCPLPDLRKYRSHRGVQQKDLDVAIAEWEQKKVKMGGR
ncbi:hypothetical protein C8R43DRAFT_1091981 [Mycena crocata]|nr:hypothetical protein C8R43DRAFT_1091981 [Mycena crocata]